MTSSSEISGAAERGGGPRLALVSIAVLGLVTLGLLLTLFVSVRGHQANIEALATGLDRREASVHALEDQRTSLEGRITDLQAQLGEGEARRGAILVEVKDLDRKKAERDAAISDRQKADASAAEARRALDAAKADLTPTQQAKDAVSEEVTDLQRTLDELQSKRADAARAVDDAEARLRDLGPQVTRL